MKGLVSFFLGQSYTVKRATALLAVSALLSNLLGLLRNVVFYRIVPPAELDIYYASFRLPDLIFNVLILGAISSAFIPVISELVTKKKEEGVWKVANQVLTWLTVLFGSFAVILFIAMPFLMRVIVPGFEEARLDQAIFISRILLLQAIFFAWSWTFGGILNSFQRFTTYAVAPLLYNASIIIGGLMARTYGIQAMAYAVVFGAALHMAIQYAEVSRLGYKPTSDFGWSTELKEIIHLMVPRSISQGMSQLMLIVFTTLASGLTAGSIAIFTGMNDLQTTPTVIVANSLAVAFFPTLTKYAFAEQWEEVSKLLGKVIRSALFLLLPSIALGYILRAQIVRLYFGIGGAGWDLTTLAIETFSWFLASIIPTALVIIFARIFYSVKDTRTPLILNTIGALVGVGVAFYTIQIGHAKVPALAMATAAAAWTQCILYLYLLNRTHKLLINMGAILRYAVSYIGGSIFMAGMAWLTLKFIDHFYKTASVLGTNVVAGLFLQMCGAALIAVTSYYLYSMLMHKEELGWLQKSIFTRRQ